MPALATPTKSAPWENTDWTSALSHTPPVQMIGGKSLIVLVNHSVSKRGSSGSHLEGEKESQHDKCKKSIHSSRKILAKEILSCRSIPILLISGEILTPIKKSLEVFDFIARIISIRNFDLLLILPPH